MATSNQPSTSTTSGINTVERAIQRKQFVDDFVDEYKKVGGLLKEPGVPQPPYENAVLYALNRIQQLKGTTVEKINTSNFFVSDSKRFAVLQSVVRQEDGAVKQHSLVTLHEELVTRTSVASKAVDMFFNKHRPSDGEPGFTVAIVCGTTEHEQCVFLRKIYLAARRVIFKARVYDSNGTHAKLLTPTLRLLQKYKLENGNWQQLMYHQAGHHQVNGSHICAPLTWLEVLINFTWDKRNPFERKVDLLPHVKNPGTGHHGNRMPKDSDKERLKLNRRNRKRAYGQMEANEANEAND